MLTVGDTPVNETTRDPLFLCFGPRLDIIRPIMKSLLARLRRRLLLWILCHDPARYMRRKGFADHIASQDRRFWDIHTALFRNRRATQTVNEQYNLWALAHRVGRLDGALAEVGVYRGGSAQILCEAKGDAALHLFDTFEGMPATDHVTDGGFREGTFGDTSLEDVQAFLSGYKNVSFHPGIFPESAKDTGCDRLVYKLVHLDADIFSSTLNALAYFYPRMVRGGILISHDYAAISVPGVRKAFDEFFSSKPEIPIPLWNTQCMIVKQ